MIRLILPIAFLLFLINPFYGQNAIQSQREVLAIDSITKTTYRTGDTLSVTIRNLTSRRRGFTLEALSLAKAPEYYDALYSAYFNDDKLFFKKLRAARRKSIVKQTKYVLPNWETKPYEIKANSDTTINFIIKGISIPKGTMLRLRVTSDIVNDDYETVYSNPIEVCSLPN